MSISPQVINQCLMKGAPIKGEQIQDDLIINLIIVFFQKFDQRNITLT